MTQMTAARMLVLQQTLEEQQHLNYAEAKELFAELEETYLDFVLLKGVVRSASHYLEGRQGAKSQLRAGVDIAKVHGLL